MAHIGVDGIRAVYDGIVTTLEKFQHSLLDD